MDLDINKVKTAKKLLENGETLRAIEREIDIDRKAIRYIVSLYDLMENQKTSPGKNSEYVCIKKSRHMIKSLKIQNRWAHLREYYIEKMAELKKKREELSEYIDKAEEIHDLKKELFYKQKMLDVTSSNLQHAEDGYEYIKREYIYTKIIYFLYGVAGGLFSILALNYFGFIC